jgi:hypothetical protein
MDKSIVDMNMVARIGTFVPKPTSRDDPEQQNLNESYESRRN